MQAILDLEEKQKQEYLEYNPYEKEAWDEEFGDRVNQLVIIEKGYNKEAITAALHSRAKIVQWTIFSESSSSYVAKVQHDIQIYGEKYENKKNNRRSSYSLRTHNISVCSKSKKI